MSEQQHYVAAATVTIDASPNDVWAIWADVNGWTHWDDGLEKSRIFGNFKAGTAISLTPKGGPDIDLKIISVTAGEEFSDEAVLPFGTIRSFHRIERMGERLKLTHEVRADIDDAASRRFESEIWPHMQAGLPVAVNNIVDIVQAR